jgi:hypothetical protein
VRAACGPLSPPGCAADVEPPAVVVSLPVVADARCVAGAPPVWCAPDSALAMAEEAEAPSGAEAAPALERDAAAPGTLSAAAAADPSAACCASSSAGTPGETTPLALDAAPARAAGASLVAGVIAVLAVLPANAAALPDAPAPVEDTVADAAAPVEDVGADAAAAVEDAAEAVASAAPGELAPADCAPAACDAGVASAEALAP